MQIIRHYQHCSPLYQDAVIALGNFDGMHLGHMELIDEAKTIAQEDDIYAGIMTFEPHPLTKFAPEKAKHFALNSFKQKMTIAQRIGLDVVFAQHFNAPFMQLSAEAFIQEVLVNHLKIRHVVIGYDFTFGKDRAGNGAMLKEYGEQYQFGVTQLPALADNTGPFSSTRIRGFVEAGNIIQANEMLGYEFSIDGRVIKGKQRGRTIGFPTLNLAFKKDRIIPKKGVYIASVYHKGNDYPAVINIGSRPTFDNGAILLEAHLLQVEGINLYGEYINVLLHDFIREERHFPHFESLKAQIAEDVDIATHYHFPPNA